MIETDTFRRNLIKKLNDAKLATMAYAETASAKLQGEAQQNRPWTDRTGQARQRLRGYVSTPEEWIVRINLAHGVDYGEYLEYGNERKYAIIEPTLRQNERSVVEGWQKAVAKI
jgi:hypothetical protein